MYQISRKKLQGLVLAAVMLLSSVVPAAAAEMPAAAEPTAAETDSVAAETDNVAAETDNVAAETDSVAAETVEEGVSAALPDEMGSPEQQAVPVQEEAVTQTEEISAVSVDLPEVAEETTETAEKTEETADEVEEAEEAESDEELLQGASAEVTYRTHCQDYGWLGWAKNGAPAGTTGVSKRMEAMNIQLVGATVAGSIEYRTHCQDYGWLGWVRDGAQTGTTGESKRLEAIEIRLTGDMAKAFDVYYRVHCQDYGWLGWAKNGESSGSAGHAKRLEAIEVQLVKKGGAAPGSTLQVFVPADSQSAVAQPDANSSALIQYATHVQNVGWQAYVGDGNASGTTGQSLRLEGIRIVLTNQKYSGSVQYRTHVQDYGWQSFVQDGDMSGTEGRSKRLEAIQIKLTGEMAQHYDIWYRVHCQDYGWMGWAKNGASSGSAGYAKRLEAIEIRLVTKGGTAPGSTENAYKEASAAGTGSSGTTMTEANWQVLINVVGAVESGGQIYGNRDYASYAGRYHASPYEYTCTLGWAQFYGALAKKLIQNIYDAGPSAFRKIDTSGAIERMLGHDWVAERWDPSASEKTTLIRLITSDIGKQKQDQLFRSEVTPLVTYCEKNYTKDAKAVIMYVEIAHLGGKSAANRIFNRCGGKYTTSNILTVLKWDQSDYSNNYQVGDAMYDRRHAKCAEFVERYVK